MVKAELFLNVCLLSLKHSADNSLAADEDLAESLT